MPALAGNEISSDLVDVSGGSFNDQYTLCTRLGDGCSAFVWSAVERETGERVACKLARRQSKFDWRLLVRTFQREAALLERISDHPSIVGLRGFFLGTQEAAIMLELVDGGDCQQLLQRHGAIAEGAVHAIVDQVCSAVVFLHERQVLHRDIKCENVLVSTGVTQSARLCDFGHSCYVQELGTSRRLDAFRGTRGYAAPEVSVSNPAWSMAADVYSIGALMYTLLGNTSLRLANGTPDFVTRNFAQVSTVSKMLLTGVLAMEPTARTELSQLASSVKMLREHSQAADAATGGQGLRRQGRLGHHTYSLHNIQLGTPPHRPAQLGSDPHSLAAVAAPISPTADAARASEPDSTADTGADGKPPSPEPRTQRMRKTWSAILTGSSRDGIYKDVKPVDSGLMAAWRKLTQPKPQCEAEPASAHPAPAPQAQPMPADGADTAAAADSSSSSSSGGPHPAKIALGSPLELAVTKHSWRGAYPRQLQLHESGIRTLEPVTRRVTHEWRWDELLDVSRDGPDSPSIAALGSGFAGFSLRVGMPCTPIGARVRFSAERKMAADVVDAARLALRHRHLMPQPASSKVGSTDPGSADAADPTRPKIPSPSALSTPGTSEVMCGGGLQ